MFFFLLEIIYPRIPGALPPQDFLLSAAPEIHLSLYIKYFVNLAVFSGGVLALLFLIYGGIKYLISTGKPEALVAAKNQITGAFFGLLLLLSSFLILKTINPEFIILKLSSLKPVEIETPANIEPPKITAIQSSIDTEIPFGRIIEKLFETYISDYPTPDPAPTPRLERIKNNANTTKEISDKLLGQSEELKDYSDDCQCSQTRPCCEISNPGPGCQDNACYSKSGTTSDPCKNVRSKIQSTENKNKTEIDNLNKENIKIEEEARLLKEQLDRLKRAEKFIKECPLRDLNSLAQFYSKKDAFDKQKWTIRETKFWDDISIRYYLQNIYGAPTKYLGTDFATFYCAVSGTMEQQPSYATPDLTGEESEEEAEEILSEEMACSKESPVGEIIDRAKKTTQLSIDKLGQLVEKDKELIEAVDKLQVLVSQCSSQRCFSFCIYEPHEGCIIKRAQDSPQYPEGPCPKSEIADQFNKIQRIWQEIKDIVDGKDKKDTSDNIGIATIIDEIAPEIIEDLEKEIRIPMRGCSSGDWLEQTKTLFNCLQAKGAIIPPDNQVLRECCQAESLNPNTGQVKQSPYGDCLEECYLKKGQEKYRECVQDCLNKKGQELNDKDLPLCINELNFYCCP